MSDEFLIPPPSNMTVEHQYKPVLYLPDGRALVRQAGFTTEASRAVPSMPETRREVPSARRARKSR